MTVFCDEGDSFIGWWSSKWSGAGFGYMSTEGDGLGHGYGLSARNDGSGYGEGFGRRLFLFMDRYAVETHLIPGLISIGCETHMLDWWKEHWRDLAEYHDVDVTYAEAAELFRRIEETR